MDYVHDLSISGREIYAFGAPNIILMSRHDRMRAGHPMSPTTLAPGAMSLTFLIKGQQTIRVDEQEYCLRGGDVFLTFPNEIVSTGNSPQEKCLFYWIHVRIPSADEPPFGLYPEANRQLCQQLLQMRPRLFRGSPAIRRLLNEIHEKRHQPQSVLLDAWFPTQITKLFYEVLACGQAHVPTKLSPSIQRTIRYVDGHLEERLSVADLATCAGMPVSSFKIQFKEQVEIPPGEYVLRTKIKEAKRRLARQHATVTETAFALGFPTSQYFATVFKRYTGQNPSHNLRK
ncbi:MAG: HTH-type transcriptional activator RhaS [Verrucomicrobiae bacterium]|nr:HTH-type transcriptional activator RhaS [Verrucomicrobiae bacterium]